MKRVGLKRRKSIEDHFTSAQIRALGLAVRYMRAERNLSRQDLSAKTGLSQNFIYRIERLGSKREGVESNDMHDDENARLPSLSTIDSLCQAFDITIDDLKRLADSRDLSENRVQMLELSNQLKEIVQDIHREFRSEDISTSFDAFVDSITIDNSTGDDENLPGDRNGQNI